MEGGLTEVQSPASFEAAFANKKKLDTAGGKVTYVECIHPDNSAGTILVIPGWSITLNTEKPLLEELYNSGRNVLSLQFPRRLGGEVDTEAADYIPKEVVRQADMIADLISARPEEKIDVTGHSMSAMVLIAAVELRPDIADKIGSVVLTSPAGVAGDDNFLKLAARFTQHLSQDMGGVLRLRGGSPIERSKLLRMIIESNKYIAKNPLRALSEARALAGSAEYEWLGAFRDSGIKVGIIQGEQDKLTPAKKLWRRIGWGHKSPFVKSDEISSGFKYDPSVTEGEVAVPFDAITMVGGGHDNRIYGEKGYAKKILNQLDLLQKTPVAEPSASV